MERFHQTLKRWLSRQPSAVTLRELRRQLDRFGRYYNTERPHRALSRRTPQEAFEARPRAVPANAGFVISEHYRVRQDRVDRGGTVTLRYNSRLHHIGLGRRYAGVRVLVLVDDLHVRIVSQEDGELLRDLTLDPGRDYQPQG